MKDLIKEAVETYYGDVVKPNNPVLKALKQKSIKGLNSTQVRDVYLIQKNIKYPL